MNGCSSGGRRCGSVLISGATHATLSFCGGSLGSAAGALEWLEMQRIQGRLDVTLPWSECWCNGSSRPMTKTRAMLVSRSQRLKGVRFWKDAIKPIEIQ